MAKAAAAPLLDDREPVARSLQLDGGPLCIVGPELLCEGCNCSQAVLNGEHTFYKLARRRQQPVNGLLFDVIYERERLTHFHTSLTINFASHLHVRGFVPPGDRVPRSVPYPPCAAFLTVYRKRTDVTTFTPK